MSRINNVRDIEMPEQDTPNNQILYLDIYMDKSYGVLG